MAVAIVGTPGLIFKKWIFLFLCQFQLRNDFMRANKMNGPLPVAFSPRKHQDEKKSREPWLKSESSFWRVCGHESESEGAHTNKKSWTF